MKNLIKKVESNKFLMDGIKERGYIGEKLKLDNRYIFSKEINAELSLSLLFSPWIENSLRVSIMINSIAVTRYFHELGLYLDLPEPESDRPTGVISVELLWLRWNQEPSQAKNYETDYVIGTERGTQRVFEDLDSVGQDYYSAISTPQALAEHLNNINHYPCRIKSGGKPVSNNPYIYAAILFLCANDAQQAQKALDEGWREYDVPSPRAYWQEVRREEFQARKQLLLQRIDQIS